MSAINTEPSKKGLKLDKTGKKKITYKIKDLSAGKYISINNLEYFAAIRILIDIYATNFTSLLTSIFESVSYKPGTTAQQKAEFEESVKSFQLFKKAADESKLYKNADVDKIDDEIVFYVKKLVKIIKNIVKADSIETLINSLGIDKSFLIEFNTAFLATLTPVDKIISTYENLNKLLCLIIIAASLDVQNTTAVLKM